MQWNIQTLLPHFLYAAEIARKVKEHPDVMIKGDRTPVTEADRGIEQYLTGIFGDGNVLGEETFERHDHEMLLDKLYHGEMWIIDPIDGTANFIHRRPIWGVSIGYAVDGVICEGGVFLPEIGDLMYSDHGKTYFSRTGVRYPDQEQLRENVRLLEEPNRVFNETSCINLSQVMTKNGLIKGVNPVITAGSCVCSGVDLASGRDAVYCTSAKLWDLAGILPCLRNAGFVSANRSGYDLLSCKILPELYQLETAAKTPYALREPNWIGVSAEADRMVMQLCSM